MNVRKIVMYSLAITLIIGIIFILAFALSYSGIFSPNDKTNEKSNRRSYSERYERLKSALTILDTMDNSVNPCDDFYKFTCGKAGNFTQLVKNINQASDIDENSDKFNDQLHNAINEINETIASRPFILIKKLFHTCMINSTNEKFGIKRLEEIIDKFGGWPVTLKNKWSEVPFNWEEIVYNVQKIGMPGNFFLYIDLIEDSNNNSKWNIMVNQPNLVFSRQQYLRGLNDPIIKKYYDHMIDTAEMLKIKADKNAIKNELLDLLNFEIELAKISLLPEDADLSYKTDDNVITLKEMHKKWPTIRWNNLINKIYEPHLVVDNNTTVFISNSTFLSMFERLMARTPKKVQKNFALWNIIKFSMSYLKNEFGDRFISDKIFNSTARLPQWKACVNMIRHHLSLGIDALYAQKYLKTDMKTHLTQMIINIKNQLVNIFSNTVKWFDDKTRINAVNKARAVMSIVSYSDDLLNDTKLTEYYEDLEINEENYLQTILNVRLFNTIKSYAKFSGPSNHDEWATMPLLMLGTDALYNPLKHSIMMSSGFVKSCFNVHRPNYMNYGSIGSVIGHELFHGFDNEGRNYDMHGNLVDWWSEEAKRIYDEKAECFVGQYNNYTIETTNRTIDGELTQRENIADAGGIRVAYLAYKTLAATAESEEILPELSYTPSQLFWITFASTWCAEQPTDDEHPPYDIRIRGSLSNIPEFAQDFQCPIGSNMNPINRCTFW